MVRTLKKISSSATCENQQSPFQDFAVLSLYRSAAGRRQFSQSAHNFIIKVSDNQLSHFDINDSTSKIVGPESSPA